MSRASNPLARMTLTASMAHPKIFGPHFAGDSWARWRAVLKAALGEPLTPEEDRLFREVAERDPPTRRVKEAVFVIGRGGGKDSTAALIASHIAATFSGQARLRPGEEAIVACIAVDRAQARIAHSYIRGFFEEIAPLKAMVVGNLDSERIALSNRIALEVYANSQKSARGRSFAVVIGDECAHWRSENSSTPDEEVIGAVMPGLARVPGSMLVLISSAHKRSGALYQRWKEFYAKNSDDVLVVRGTTLQFNPTFDRQAIEKALERDRQLYGAEYLSEWRDDLATFISRDLLDAAVDRGVVIRPPAPGVSHVAFADPSGGVSDSFTCSIAHREGDVAVLDVLFEKRAPFDPDGTVREIAELLKSYRCHTVTGDRYGAAWVSSAFERHGIRYTASERDRSAVYLDALPLFTSGRARLIDNQRMVSQFAALERRTFANGRDRVDHGASGKDDASNAAAGALVLAGIKRPLVISDELLARSARLPDWERARRQQMGGW